MSRSGLRKMLWSGAVTMGLLAMVWLWDSSARLRGDLSARIDMRRGHYKVLAYGLPSPTRPAYSKCLRERYGIGFEVVALCIVSRSLVDYANGYDAAVVGAVNKRAGRDVFKECYLEAEASVNSGD